MAAPGRPVGSVDLDNVNPIVLQCLCEPGPIAASALDASNEHLSEALRPLPGDVVTGRVGAKLGIAKQLAGVGDGRDVNGVEMSIDADDDPAWGCHDG